MPCLTGVDSDRPPYPDCYSAANHAQSAQRKLRYLSVLDDERETPAWIDGVLGKAVHANPLKRYETLTEYIHDLRHPNRAFLHKTRPPLVERHPVRFWKGVAAVLATIVVALAFIRFGIP